MPRELSKRQEQFILLYDGNGTDTARKAGYRGSENALGKTAFDLLRNPKVAALIKQRQDREIRPKIATRFERQEFWSKVMLDLKQEMNNRLKASELLGKSEADFTEKISHGVEGIDLPLLIQKAREARQLKNKPNETKQIE